MLVFQSFGSRINNHIKKASVSCHAQSASLLQLHKKHPLSLQTKLEKPKSNLKPKTECKTKDESTTILNKLRPIADRNTNTKNVKNNINNNILSTHNTQDISNNVTNGTLMDGKSSLYRSSMERDACGVGLIANINSKASRTIVESANEMLVSMSHRGGTGVCELDGDGAGILTAIPLNFFKKVLKEEKNIILTGTEGNYGIGNIFFGNNIELNNKIKKLFYQIIEKEFGYNIITFRQIPVNSNVLGSAAKSTEPIIEQIFIENTKNVAKYIFETKLLLLRHILSNRIRSMLNLSKKYLYICSLSNKTMVYKGQFTSSQLFEYYNNDLNDKDFISNFALIHSRYSTNTIPSWDRAQPNRVCCHNGEINTLRGNKNWMYTRQQKSHSNWFGKNTSLLYPICSDDLSDSGNFDNVLELLTKASDDRTIAESIITMIPEAWQNDVYHIINENQNNKNKQKMYEYLSCIMEPWDGPALMAFCDGNYIGAMLDRNGLRPSRYYITNDNNIILSSEAGVMRSLDENKIIYKHRLEPGKILLVDLKNEKIVSDDEIKHKLSNKFPYKQWLDDNIIYLRELVKKYNIQELKLKNPGLGGTVHTDMDQLIGVNFDYNANFRSTGIINTPSEITMGGDSTGNLAGVNNTPLHDHLPSMGLDFELTNKLNCFGFTTENVQYLLIPMIMHGKESLGSMGNDASLAILSNQPKLPFEYFKQLFAQVTNPPIDPIRERVVMSLRAPVGPEQNLFTQTPKHCQRIMIENPILTINGINVLKNIEKYDIGNDNNNNYWKSKVLDCTFDAYSGKESLIERINELCFEASYLISKNNTNIIILSDRLISKDRFPIPSLLTLGAVHHYLIHKQLRSDVALFVESGDAKEVHDFCTLIGYGADGICPYMAYQLFEKLENDKMIPKCDINSYRDAIVKGILKVMSKMGVSTLQGYKGAQLFEAVGLHDDVINKCFANTESRIGGATFDTLYNDIARLHEYGYGAATLADDKHTTDNDNMSSSSSSSDDNSSNDSSIHLLRNPGSYHFRDKSEFHFNTPETISSLQNAVRLNSQEMYDEYTKYSNEQASKVTLRGLLEWNYDTINREPISIHNVEPIESIMKRFNTGAMSLGSISKETHETLAKAMNKIGGRSNTGEGGEDPIRLHNPETRSAIKQVASGRFGVTINYLTNADQIQIKIAQGAKPGEGGELPGNKVNDYIGSMRYTTPGVGLISPPPHHDIYSIEDLSQLIFDLKQCNPNAEISVKLVSEIGVGIVAAGVAKAKANHITISGHDGGTGASAWTGIKYAGLPWELGIAEVQQTLVLNDLRNRVKLQTDGQLKTAKDIIIAAMLGAEEYGFATAPLIALGCIMMRKCHLNTCPVGIATQDEELRKKFGGQPEHVINYFYFLANEIRDLMARLGFKTINELIGKSDYLKVNEKKLNKKSKYINLKPLLVSNKNEYNTVKVAPEDNGLDYKLINLCSDVINDYENDIENGKRIELDNVNITNSNRTVGATLSYTIAKKYGANGLGGNDNTIKIHFIGYGGQSFGMCLIKGVTMLLEGEGNDYVGKSLSGGIIGIYPNNNNKFLTYNAHNNIIAGNACLYGATNGKLFLNGQVGERFAVRNSGVYTVVEGVGNHGCEYMTGGRVIVIGKIGINFAAGMSGGIAYVINNNANNKINEILKKEIEKKYGENYSIKAKNMDEFIHDTKKYEYRINKETINLQNTNNDDLEFIKELLTQHVEYTNSIKGKKILNLLNGNEVINGIDCDQLFVKVMPIEYEKVLEKQKEMENNNNNDNNEINMTESLETSQKIANV